MIPYQCNTDQPTNLYHHALKPNAMLCDGMVIDRWIKICIAGRVERVRCKEKNERRVGVTRVTFDFGDDERLRE